MFENDPARILMLGLDAAGDFLMLKQFNPYESKGFQNAIFISIIC